MKYIKPKYLKIIISIAVIAGAVTVFVLWAKSPHQGSVSKTQSPIGPAAYSDKQLNGKYLSFQYSGKYVAQSGGAKDNDLEIFILSAATQYEKRIVASVASLPDGKVESNGSYIYRQASTVTYSNRKVIVEGVPVDVWVKKDGLEQTAMIPHGNKLGVISFVTTNANDDLTGEMDTLLKTFRWKQ